MAKGKSKKPENSKKAEAAYAEIDEGGFDLKALIAASKGALAQKQAANTKKKKATAKSLMAEAQNKLKQQEAYIKQMEGKLKEGKLTSNNEKVKDAKLDKAQALQKKAKEKQEADEKAAMKKGLGLVKPEDLQRYAKGMLALSRVERVIEDYAIGGEPDDTTNKALKVDYALAAVVPPLFLTSKTALAAKKAFTERLHEAKKSITALTHKASMAERFMGKFERDDSGVLSMRGTAGKALALVGGKLADKAKQPFMKMYEGIAKHAHSFMDNNPKTANALRYIGGKVGALATNVKDVGHEAYSWIAKKLSFLGNMLRGFLKVPNLGGSGMFGNLLGLAALLPTIIGPALAGINAELERRFGEHYIKDFITSMWDKAWGFLTDKVKQLLGIRDQSDVEQKKAKVAADLALANPTPENAKAASDQRVKGLTEQYNNTGDPQFKKMAELQQAYPSGPQEIDKGRVKAAMQQQKEGTLGSNGIFGFFKNTESLQKIVDASQPGSIDPAMEKELEDMGVKVRGRSGPRRDGRASTTPKLGTVPMSSSAPMDGAPVTAVPGGNDNSGGNKLAPTGAGGGRGGGGVTIPMVPNRMGSEIAPALETVH